METEVIETPETPIPERTAQNMDRVAVAAEGLRDRVVSEVMQGVASVLESEFTPDRSTLARISGDDDNPTRPALAGARIGSPYALEYQRMSPEVKQWRDADSDHYMAQWIRGQSFKNHGLIREAEAHMDARFGRAILLEGAISTTTGIGDGTGQELLPIPLASLIMLARDRQAKLRPMLRRFTSTGIALRVPLSPVATAAMAAEGADAADGTPNPTQKILSKKKAQAHFSASIEMVEDSAFNLVSYLSERAGSALGALEDVQICTSNGTPPNISASIVAGLTEVDEATTTVLIYQDLVDLYFGVPSQYRSGAVWLMGDVVIALVSSMTDDSGRPMFVPGGVAQAPTVLGDEAGATGTLLGKPVFNVPLADGTIYFGNPQESYAMLDGGGITFRTSEHELWSTDSVAWKFTERFDGNSMTVDAARIVAAIASVA